MAQLKNKSKASNQKSTYFEGQDIRDELKLVVSNRGETIRQKQAQASGTRRHTFVPGDIDLIVESLGEDDWNMVRGMLQSESIDLHQLRALFDKQAIALGWKVKADTDVKFHLSMLRDWVRQQRMGEVAVQIEKDLAPFRGLPTKAILEKIVYDCYDQAEKIRSWLFESGAAELSDSELLKAYPQMQAAAIKGIESLHRLNQHQIRKAGQIDGARRMAFAIYEIVKGTALENTIQAIIADVVLEIEGEEDCTP